MCCSCPPLQLKWSWIQWWWKTFSGKWLSWESSSIQMSLNCLEWLHIRTNPVSSYLWWKWIWNNTSNKMNRQVLWNFVSILFTYQNCSQWYLFCSTVLKNISNPSVWELLMGWNICLTLTLFIVIWLPETVCQYHFINFSSVPTFALSKCKMFPWHRLDRNLILKISDFGLSRDIQHKEYYKVENTSVELPVRWMSPESLTDWIFTSKSDVVMMFCVFPLISLPVPNVAWELSIFDTILCLSHCS